jgi:hypothetical protein|tara:strand:+ start:2179 stop:2784 length:606 start_codon:yes stop_codon:yes gene_type:complete
MDIDVFKRGFKLVEYIYDNQIQDLELFRIRDVGNGLAESHWKSKQWLVDELSEFLYNEDVHIAAGWLGLTGYLLRKKFPDINITSSDIDPGCKIMGKFLFDNIEFKTLDTVLDINIVKDCQVYINTSIEHIEQKYIDIIFNSLKKGTMFAIQSNNYYSVADHINCSDSLDDFKSKTICSEILYCDKLKFKEYDRYMIIGIV